AKALGKHHRVDDIADALRHLLAPAKQEAVAVDLLGKLDPRRHQEGRPIDGMEADDVLADQVDVRRPVAAPKFGIVRIAEAGDVVGQRVEPDIHYMAVASRHWDAPVKARPRNAEVLQSAFDKADNLIPPAVRLDEIRICRIKVEQRL